jgi:hypothetical protein
MELYEKTHIRKVDRGEEVRNLVDCRLEAFVVIFFLIHLIFVIL